MLMCCGTATHGYTRLWEERNHERTEDEPRGKHGHTRYRNDHSTQISTNDDHNVHNWSAHTTTHYDVSRIFTNFMSLTARRFLSSALTRCLRAIISSRFAFSSLRRCTSGRSRNLARVRSRILQPIWRIRRQFTTTANAITTVRWECEV